MADAPFHTGAWPLGLPRDHNRDTTETGVLRCDDLERGRSQGDWVPGARQMVWHTRTSGPLCATADVWA